MMLILVLGLAALFVYLADQRNPTLALIDRYIGNPQKPLTNRDWWANPGSERLNSMLWAGIGALGTWAAFLLSRLNSLVFWRLFDLQHDISPLERWQTQYIENLSTAHGWQPFERLLTLAILSALNFSIALLALGYMLVGAEPDIWRGFIMASVVIGGITVNAAYIYQLQKFVKASYCVAWDRAYDALLGKRAAMPEDWVTQARIEEMNRSAGFPVPGVRRRFTFLFGLAFANAALLLSLMQWLTDVPPNGEDPAPDGEVSSQNGSPPAKN